jgi:hypothetical protein
MKKIEKKEFWFLLIFVLLFATILSVVPRWPENPSGQLLLPISEIKKRAPITFGMALCVYLVSIIIYLLRKK